MAVRFLHKKTYRAIGFLPVNLCADHAGKFRFEWGFFIGFASMLTIGSGRVPCRDFRLQRDDLESRNLGAEKNILL
jgi:hypothetical protein